MGVEKYKDAFEGGTQLDNFPVGATVGASNFLGSIIIERLVPYLRCENL